MHAAKELSKLACGVLLVTVHGSFVIFKQCVTMLCESTPCCVCGQDALVIGSRFDADVSKATCRLAFYGRLAAILDADKPGELARLRVYKLKRKAGSIDRVERDGLSAVCKGMFKKETDISLFAGMQARPAPFPCMNTAHGPALCMQCIVAQLDSTRMHVLV
jgi:hypothetical protein